MNKKARLICTFLSLIMVVSTFTACGKKSDLGTSTKEVSGKEITFPLKDKITLKYFMNLDPKVSATMKSNGEIESYKKLEEITGIHIEWIHPPVGQENEQFNLMLASSNLPDMIFWNWNAFPGGPLKAIQNGIIIKLNDELKKDAPNLKEILDKYPEVAKQSLLDDGTYYMAPMIRLRKDKGEWYKTYGPMIRKDWLDKLQLKVPNTIDELYNVLKAFKEKDPNGNGKQDEIPFISKKDMGLKDLASAFGVVSSFYNNNGSIKYGPIEPAYKDYLSTLNKWYKEGLIDKEYLSVDEKNFDSKATSDLGGYFSGYLSAHMGRYIGLKKGKSPEFNIVAVPWTAGTSGKSYTSFSDYNKLVPGFGASITKSNKHVRESIKWLDYAYSEKGNLLFNFGIDGESYTMKDNKPVFTDEVLKSPKGYSIDQAISRYCPANANAAMIKDPVYFEQISLMYQQQKDAQTYWDKADKSLLLPPVSLTSEESPEFVSIMSEIDTYANEMFNKFVMGIEPLDKFDSYVEKIKKMNIEKAIKINQDAFNRYQKRK